MLDHATPYWQGSVKPVALYYVEMYHVNMSFWLLPKAGNPVIIPPVIYSSLRCKINPDHSVSTVSASYMYRLVMIFCRTTIVVNLTFLTLYITLKVSIHMLQKDEHTILSGTEDILQIIFIGTDLKPGAKNIVTIYVSI